MGKTGRCFGVWKNLQVALENSMSENYSGVDSKQGTEEEGNHPTQTTLRWWDRGGLGFGAMPRLVLPYKKNLKREGSRDTELWCTTRADTWCLTGISGPDSAPAVIKINTLQAMYSEDAFKPTALPYCFSIKANQEDFPLVDPGNCRIAGRSNYNYDGSTSLSEAEIAAGCHWIRGRPHYTHSPWHGKAEWSRINTLGSYSVSHG